MSITNGTTSINFSFSYTRISVYYPKITLSVCGDVESCVDLDLSMTETSFFGFKDTNLFEVSNIHPSSSKLILDPLLILRIVSIYCGCHGIRQTTCNSMAMFVEIECSDFFEQMFIKN